MQNNIDFIVVGPPRTGTTWLDKVLRVHPKINLPKTKQIHFFDKNYDKGLDWYFSNFNIENEKIYGEITPDYISEESYIENIAKTFPNIKIIMMYRDPIERAFSHYKIRKMHGKIKGTFVENFTKDYYLMHNSLYGEHLKSIEKYFDRLNIKILNYREIKTSPEKLIEALENFLNIENIKISKEVLYNKIGQSNKKNKLKVFLKSFNLNSIFYKDEALSLDEYNTCKNIIQEDIDLFHKLREKYE